MGFFLRAHRAIVVCAGAVVPRGQADIHRVAIPGQLGVGCHPALGMAAHALGRGAVHGLAGSIGLTRRVMGQMASRAHARFHGRVPFEIFFAFG